MATGVFFHYQQGKRLKDFPEALGGILSMNDVFFFDALYPLKPQSSFDLKPVSLESLYKVHAPAMVENVKASGTYNGALYSAAGTVSAALKIASGELKNAFVFTGYGDHHAGSTFFGGGCYLNGAAMAIREVQARTEMKQFAIIDTDAHHGDGTWDLFQNDLHVLYLCFCTEVSREHNGNVNIQVPAGVGDNGYLALAKSAFEKYVEVFKPAIIFWNWGYDGTIGEYGDMALTPEFHLQLAMEVKKVAEKVCNGRLITVLCGGHSRELAALLIPGIIRVLAT